MISYLEGELTATYDDNITLLVGGIGYDILIPAYLMNEIKEDEGKGSKKLKLHISYNQTERQPKPILVGFKNSLDKEFFELFISVEDIGPTAAIKALIKPVGDISRSIEGKDARALKQLKGIGERKAEKIIATLKGKVARYALMPKIEVAAEVVEDFSKEVEDVLVRKLGHKSIEARKMIEEAMKRNSRINSSEELFEEIYRGQKK
ncbi:MAG: helix-hairpin-helix domain-containing protein [Candidatus Mariimomonas ferrooxydans]